MLEGLVFTQPLQSSSLECTKPMIICSSTPRQGTVLYSLYSIHSVVYSIKKWSIECEGEGFFRNVCSFCSFFFICKFFLIIINMPAISKKILILIPAFQTFSWRTKTVKLCQKYYSLDFVQSLYKLPLDCFVSFITNKYEMFSFLMAS